MRHARENYSSRLVLSLLLLCAGGGCALNHQNIQIQPSLSDYLKLSEEDKNWLKTPGDFGVYERAQHLRIGDFDVFTETEDFQGARRLYVARNGAILAIIDSEPGGAEIFDGESLPFEFKARISADLSGGAITYRGNGFTVEDRGWDGPDVIYQNGGGSAQDWSYTEGSEVRFPGLTGSCVQAFPQIERIACCPGEESLPWEAWSFQPSEGWRKVDNGTLAAETCAQLGKQSTPDDHGS